MTKTRLFLAQNFSGSVIDISIYQEVRKYGTNSTTKPFGKFSIN